MALVSIQSAEKHPDQEAPTVHSDVAEGKIVRWLETPLPIRIAYQLTPTELTVSRSVETLRRHLAAKSSQESPTAFSAYRDQWFPDSGVFACVNARKLRDAQHAAGLLARPNAGGEESLRAWFGQVWRLFDAAYLGAKFEPDRATIRLGIVVEELR
jgi:hypothetical protein